MTTVEPYDALILAGGAAARLRGADKPGLLVGGRALVSRVAAAVAGAQRIVLVGPDRPELPDAITVREDPPGAGPVPALRTGLHSVHAPWVAVLAADLPFLTADDVDALRDQACGRSGAVFVDDGDTPQWLTGVWRTATLRAALAAYPGASLRGLMSPLDPARVRAAERRRPAWYDCDTDDDVAQASRLIEEHGA